jgi:hypothetical protein
MSSSGSGRAPIEAMMRSSAVRTERSIAVLRITPPCRETIGVAVGVFTQHLPVQRPPASACPGFADLEVDVTKLTVPTGDPN